VRHVGFCVFGIHQDIQGGGRNTRWNHFRPTLAFAAQKVRPLKTLHLVCLPWKTKAAKHLETLRRDLQEAAPEVRLVEHHADFSDPYDHIQCGRFFWQVMCKNFSENDPSPWLLQVNTGTHAAQFVLHILAHRQEVPSELVQTMPGSMGTPRKNHTTGAGLRTLDLRWTLTSPDRWGEIEKDEAEAGDKTNLWSRNPEIQKHFCEIVDLVGARTSDSILLLGETGTGKTYLAEKIHQSWCSYLERSPKHTPFEEANCAGFSRELAHSQLFGHFKGAFTGAASDHTGLLERADGGTVFLDEIGELLPETQALLLKSLEKQEVTPLGGTKSKKVSFRLLCATNRNLEEEVAAGKFRQDLHARIRRWTYHLPPLHERGEDLEWLIDTQLKKWSEQEGKKREIIPFSRAAKKRFLSFASSPQAKWPGNMRELFDAVARMALFASITRHVRIDEDIVEQEIQRLEKQWRPLSSTSEHSDLELTEMLAASAQKHAPDLPLFLAVESWLRSLAIKGRQLTKAAAGRWLYKHPRDTRKDFNHTTRFSGRGEIIENQRAKKFDQPPKTVEPKK
jgi:transcriptional regulatory protein RtcR